MKLGDCAFVFAVAFVCASVFFAFCKLTCSLLNCGDCEPVTFALTVIVVYWRLLDKGGQL
jgi:hypothetical protein